MSPKFAAELVHFNLELQLVLLSPFALYLCDIIPLCVLLLFAFLTPLHHSVITTSSNDAFLFSPDPR